MTFIYVLDDEARRLFVDDDPILRDFARVNLASAAAVIHVAGDGIEALEALGRNRYDLLFVDLEMPRMDAFELLAHLRAAPATAHLPIVVETGREDVEAIDGAWAGAAAFVTKPLNWSLLSHQLRFALKAAHAEACPRQRFADPERVAA